MKFRRTAALVLTLAMTASLVSGCGMNKNAVVARAGSEAVTLGMVNFMVRFEQADMDDLYRAYFGDDVWEQDLYGNGSTMADETKNDVMDTLHELYTVSQADNMAQYDVSLTDEEETAIKEAAAEFIADNSKAALREMGATEAYAEKMLRMYTIQTKMKAAIAATADTEVSDEEANMRGYTYIRQSISTYYDSSTGSYAEYTDDEIQQYELIMQAIYSAMEEGEDMDTAAEAYGMSTTYGTYDADNESLDSTVKDTLDSLEVGDIAGPIVTDSYIYIVRLDTETDEDATEDNRESIIEDRQDTAYDDQLSAWEEDDGWSVSEKQLAKISFKNAFTQETETEESTDTTEVSTETVDGTEAE